MADATEKQRVGRVSKACFAAIAKWGKEHQLRKVSEECSELSAAVTQLEDGRISLDTFAGEAADVFLVLVQARMIIGEEVFLEALERSLSRLEGHIDHD